MIRPESPQVICSKICQQVCIHSVSAQQRPTSEAVKKSNRTLLEGQRQLQNPHQWGELDNLVKRALVPADSILRICGSSLKLRQISAYGTDLALV